MAVLGFYNANSLRSYPLVADVAPTMYIGVEPAVLPDNAIVELITCVGPDVVWGDDDYVYLSAIHRTGDVLRFEFRASAPELADYVLTFERAIDAAEFTAETADAVAGSTSALCPAGWAWWGTLVTGELDDLTDLLTDGESLEAATDDLRIEPANTQATYNTFVRSINLANVDRTRATPAESCGSATDVLDHVLINAECLTGTLRMAAGFNCVLQQNTLENSITIGAAVGAGAGAPCDEVPLTEEEESESALLTGGPTCRELISTINGVTTRNLRLIGGTGVLVAAGETPHTLSITVDYHGLAVCT